MSSQKKQLVTVRVGTRGRSPIIINSMAEDTLEGLRTRNRKPVDTESAPKDLAERKLYLDEQGRICMPTGNIFACLRDGGMWVKNNTRLITSEKLGTMVPRMLMIKGDSFPLNNGNGDGKAPEWVVDKRRGVLHNKGSETAVCLIRPKIKEWGLEFDIVIDTRFTTVETVRKLIAMAGVAAGLCDFRPGCDGPFGMFELVKFDLIATEDVEPIDYVEESDGTQAAADVSTAEPTNQTVNS